MGEINMTKIVGVLNYKGGTGKTTTVVNLAAGLAIRGSRVLCIDLDAQGSLATCLGVHHTYSLAHLLLGKEEPLTCIMNVRDNLDLIPSDRNLLQAEGALWRMGDNGVARHVLAKKMQGVDGYDYIILDHSPSASLINENGLLYAHQVIVPVSMNYLALIGTRQVLQTLKTIGQLPDHNVQLALIVPTFYYGWLRKDREVMEILQRHFSGKISDPIRINVSLVEAMGRQMSIYEYAPRSVGAIDYARLVERVVSDGK
jgi:chromosome partitioning protein